MSWRLAKSLITLRAQINALFPNRSKISDGALGDAKHAARVSDHNPNQNGVVTAIDITFDTDPADGIGVDARKLAALLSTRADPRIKYLIFDNKITEKNNVRQWKPYAGASPHKHHIHISVSANPRHYDDDRAWDLTGLKTATATPTAAVRETISHTVGAGETLISIAQIYNTSPNDLVLLNGLKNPNRIRAGQILIVK